MLKFDDRKLPINLVILTIIFLFFSLSANKYVSVFTVSVVKNAEITIKNGTLSLHPIDKEYGFATEINFRSEYTFSSLELAILTLITGIELTTLIQLPLGIILVLSLLALYKELKFTGTISYILLYLSVTYMLTLFYSNYSVFSISWFLLILSIILFIRIYMKTSKEDIITLILIFWAMTNYHYTPPFIFLAFPLSFIIYTFYIEYMFKSKISVINFNKCKNIELIATVIFIMKIIEGTFLSYYNLRAMVENFGISIFKVINSFLEGSSTLNPRTSNPLIYYSETLSFSIEIVGILCFAFLKHFLKPKARKNNRFFLITVFVIFVLISSIAEILVYYSTPAGLILSIPRPFQIFGHIPLIGSLMLLNHFDSLLLRKRYLKIIRMLLLVIFSILIFLKSLGLFIRFVDQNIYYSYEGVLRREDLTIADFIAKHADYSIRIYGSGDVIGHIALLTNINYTSHLISYLPTVSGTSYINSLDALIILTEKSNRWIFYGVRQQIPANYINLTGILSFASGKVYDDGNNIAII